jgi:transposase-like protein
VSYCCGETITELAEQSGATPASVFRWIEEARESIKGDGEMVEWVVEALVDAVDFALAMENKSNAVKDVSSELLKQIEWLDSLFNLRRSPEAGFVPNLEALGWTDANRIPTDAEFSALLTKRIEEISDIIRTSDYQLPSLRRS